MKSNSRIGLSRKHRGQGFVELAFLVPSLMILLLAMVEVTWWMRSYIVAGTAAREGARFGSRGPHLTGDPNLKALDIATLTADSMDYLINTDIAGGDPNTAIFITLVEIDKHGNLKYLTTGHHVKMGGLAGVSSRVCDTSPCPGDSLDLTQIEADNTAFGAAYCLDPQAVCNNDIVIVEVYYNHKPLIFRFDFLPERILTYSRSIMRVVANKSTPTPSNAP